MQGYPDTIVILGAGPGGEMTYWVLKETYPDVKVVFIDDDPQHDYAQMGDEQVPVTSDWSLGAFRTGQSHPHGFRQFLISSTRPSTKKLLVDKARAAGLEPAPPLVHPRAHLHGAPTITLKPGVIMYPLSLVSIHSVIGENVHIFPGGTVGHHCTVGDCSALNSCSMINGYVTLGEGVLLGSGSMVKEYVSIAPWATIGIQAAVIANIDEPRATYAGVPAKRLPRSGS